MAEDYSPELAARARERLKKVMGEKNWNAFVRARRRSKKQWFKDMKMWGPIIEPLLKKIGFGCIYCLEKSFEKFRKTRVRNQYVAFIGRANTQGLPEKILDIIVLHEELKAKGVIVSCDRCAGIMPRTDCSKRVP